MSAGTASAVADLHVEAGELSFTVEAGSERQRVSFRSDTPVLPATDGVLAATLMPAMSRGGALRRLRATAPKLGLPLHVVTTDVRTFSDPLLRYRRRSAPAGRSTTSGAARD